VAGSLILSLETDSDAGVEQAWAAEVDRRLAAFPQDKKRAVAWSTVRAQIARHRRVWPAPGPRTGTGTWT